MSHSVEAYFFLTAHIFRLMCHLSEGILESRPALLKSPAQAQLAPLPLHFKQAVSRL